MRFKKHSDLEGKHAILSPSRYHWINYDSDKMARIFVAQLAAARGTRLHDIAAKLIRDGIKLPDSSQTLNRYVNDCIGFRMTPEVILVYSDNAFGTADAVRYDEEEKLLRIFDLKNGMIDGSFHQLEVYAALYCLEYRMRPFNMDIELRIYQHDDVSIFMADPDVIFHHMDKLITFNKLYESLKEELRP